MTLLGGIKHRSNTYMVSAPANTGERLFVLGTDCPQALITTANVITIGLQDQHLLFPFMAT